MTETDMLYVFKRLGYKPDQPVAQALRRVIIQNSPYGPAARTFNVPAHRLAHAVAAAKAIAEYFTVTDDEVRGMTPNEVLAYVRAKEARPPEPAAVLTASRLRAAGLTEDQVLALMGEPK